MKKMKTTTARLLETALRRHFAKHSLHELVSASRMFPTSARVDLQRALEKLLPERSDTRQFGVHRLRLNHRVTPRPHRSLDVQGTWTVTAFTGHIRL